MLEKFSADWCVPCKDAADSYAQLFDEAFDDQHVIMVNYQVNDHFTNAMSKTSRDFIYILNDNNEADYMRYDVKSIPTVFKNGVLKVSAAHRIF